MKRLLSLALLLCSVPLAAQAPVSAESRSELRLDSAGIVQVAVNYGPRQDGFFAGVVVGDGRMVLTDGGTAARAREIAIAFPDGEIMETVMAQIQYFNHIAVLPMAGRHGQVVPLAALARETAPQADVEAVAGGAPKAFQVDRRGVHLHPVGSGVTLRWQIMPPLPPQFRGGPLLNSQGQLIAVIVQEGQTLVGMPLGEMLAMVDAAASPPPATPPSLQAATRPAESEPKAEPKSESVDKPSIPDLKPDADSHPAIAKETKIENAESPRATPADDSLSSIFKDSAIAPLRVEAPVVPKPVPPAVSGPPVSAMNMPLPPIRTTWAWKEVPPPIPSVSVKLPPIRTAWAWNEAALPPVAAAPVPPPQAVQRQTAKGKPQKAAATKPSATSSQASASEPRSEAAPRDVEAFLHRAADLMQTKDYPKAVDTLEEAVRQHPDAANLYFQLALAYWYKALQKPDGSRRSTMEKASYHKAIKAFQTLLEKAPNDPLANEARMRLTVLRNAQYGGGF